MSDLYDLLPALYRRRDAERDGALRALLETIGAQGDVVEADLWALYANWFIETCADWIVPYIGDLVGDRPRPDPGAGDAHDAGALDRLRLLHPRREVANVIRHRRRKGSAALLELLAQDVAGWPGRATESYRRVAFAQALNSPLPARGRWADLRDGLAIEASGGPFDALARTADLRRASTRRTLGGPDLPGTELTVWRLRVHSITAAPAHRQDAVAPHCFSFNALGHDAQLFTRPRAQRDPAAIAGRLNLPAPITRRELARDPEAFAGEERSFTIWLQRGKQAVPAERIVSADLSDWSYRPQRDAVAVDPVRGRIAFHPRQPPRGVWVSYHTAFSADIGGGEYERRVHDPHESVLLRVGPGQRHRRLTDALAAWRRDAPAAAVIEIMDSGVYAEQLEIELAEHQSLQLRAAIGARPIIRLLDWQTEASDALTIIGAAGSRFTLDGLLVTGQAMVVTGDLAQLTLRHCTLVPGWGLDHECEPRRPAEPSLQLTNTSACVRIERSILGSIQVSEDEVRTDPVAISIADSILDATGETRLALGGPPSLPVAHASLSLSGVTVFGEVRVHELELAENSIFDGALFVARRQTGCVRFCWLHAGHCRTPRRHHCQPDLALAAAPPSQRTLILARVRPHLSSTRYGRPGYAQLTRAPVEIREGADDASEMGAFHHLYQPQREANLRARLDEYAPPDTGLIFAT